MVKFRKILKYLYNAFVLAILIYSLTIMYNDTKEIEIKNSRMDILENLSEGAVTVFSKGQTVYPTRIYSDNRTKIFKPELCDISTCFKKWNPENNSKLVVIIDLGEVNETKEKEI